MDEIAARMLTNALANAEQQLDRATTSVQRHVGYLSSNPLGTSDWGNLAHDVAEGAYWAGQVRALRDAATMAGVT